MNRTFLSALADPVFSVQVMPDAVVAHPAWCRTCAAALEALAACNHVVLVGLPGSGKSLLLRNLAHALQRDGRPAHLIGRTGVPGGVSAGGIPLIDDADTFGADALAVLAGGAGPVVLAMLPGGPGRLPQHPRPFHPVALDPLTPSEVQGFVTARLAAAGRPADLLDTDAVLALARHSAGLPRMVNVLAGAAVFLAGLEGSPRVRLRHVEEAAAMREDSIEDAAAARPAPSGPLFPMLPSPRTAMLRRRAALGGMVAASGALFGLPWLKPGLPGSLPQASAGTSNEAMVQVARIDVDALPAVDPLAVAEAAAPELPGASDDSTDLAALPEPEALPVVVADASPAPQPGPQPAARPGEPRAAVAPGGPVLFRGPIFNETMKQAGHVRVVLHKQATAGAVTARFDASQGLSGTGLLAGRLSEGGQITASGQLLMGRNPFLCNFRGTLNGDTLTGSASFVRNGTSTVYHSRFNLVRTA